MKCGCEWSTQKSDSLVLVSGACYQSQAASGFKDLVLDKQALNFQLWLALGGDVEYLFCIDQVDLEKFEGLEGIVSSIRP